MVKTSGNPDNRTNKKKPSGFHEIQTTEHGIRKIGHHSYEVTDPHTGDVWETSYKPVDLYRRLLNKERAAGFPNFEAEQRLRKKYGKDWIYHEDELSTKDYEEKH